MHGQHLLLGIDGPELSSAEATRFERLKPGGFILFTRNIEGPEQTRALTDSLRELSTGDPIIAIDQEGGRVTRTAAISPALPSAPELAEHGDQNAIGRAGVLTGDQLSMLGFNLNFGPVLDIDHFPGSQNALRGRCWGQGSQQVINRAGQWNRWMRKRGPRSCGKHFPACGRAQSDPHHDLPVSGATREELLAEDILPYTALMPELDSIMLAHVLYPNLDPELPASLSHKIVTGLLRNQLGFDKHLVLTDDLDMAAIADRFPDNRDVSAALQAGNDMAMICHRTERASDAADRIASLGASILQDSSKRLERFRSRLPSAPKWNRDKWNQYCDEITELRTSVPRLEGPEHQVTSPVGDY